MTHQEIISSLQAAASKLAELNTKAQADYAKAQTAQLDSATVSLLDPGPLGVASGGIQDAIQKIGNHQANLMQLASNLLANVAPAEAGEIKTSAQWPVGTSV